ncbi:thiol:disulfide interchange protein DsbD [Leeuwenhoekiella aestuarii]|uniref:Thiol:disulfide interchange protein DsbD n=1 Tax=Leeuwenhoekiella aestuarii TaxID=2249426 RepID=A0A4V1KNQ6_9FLAO|nr:protein-disulfide reductase DsbD domain-containing protein [Leeuwenhoekiella aestuarii]RXG11536.1 thiol:disulfide interchange protein DsbD [Leeuwenhoekiella aestuarii]RXG12053.1 thiol:disulfide interchange protein DsbD [Leeuwenhoekiella aestuarii]
MRVFLFLLSISFSLQSLNAQIYDPVSFETAVVQKKQGEYELQIKVQLEAGWHLYAQQVPEGGPIPTSFEFEASENYELNGVVKEPKGKEVDDPVFEMRIKYFEDEVLFTQKILRKTPNVFTINAVMNYMVCNDESCLPPEGKALEFLLNQEPEQPAKAAPETQQAVKETIKPSNPAPREEEFDNQADAQANLDTTSNQQAAIKETEKQNDSLDTFQTSTNIQSKSENFTSGGNQTEESRGLLTIFILSFLGGFAALLTPCVFPMIPMTVSFFTKQSKTRASGIKNALLYGLFIIVIYVVLGSAVTTIFGADSLNALSTNVVFNLVFFTLLVFFACSFLGAFELVLPSSWATKIDSQADRGGLIGIFFMALALAIVSFSCTGPIVGTLLVESASKGGIAPIVGMLGFSLAIALPFALFAAFPGWLNSLPKSGGWLNTVKVVLGFLELAFAFKFLSNADLVLQLHLLERETFLAIWIAIFGVLAFYLFGKITLPHDSPLPHISVGRLGLGLFVLAFVVYMIPGLWGAPLQWISGFPPPTQYSESPYGVGNSKGVASTSIELPDQAELGPLDLITFKDYEAGMAYAKKVNKPVMLDFTGYACVNCRKMEERVWPEPKVQQVLRDELVLISLYVDDKKELPEAEQYISETTGKKITTIGNKWSDFQIKHYKANAQPYYVLINNEGENLNIPTAYDPDVESYLNWLKEGLGQFRN